MKYYSFDFFPTIQKWEKNIINMQAIQKQVMWTMGHVD